MTIPPEPKPVEKAEDSSPASQSLGSPERV